MAKARIPAANHEFIRGIAVAVGIAGYRAMARADKPYVIASRRDGLPDLHIYYGFTNGFGSRDDAARIAGGAAVAPSSSRRGTWFVTHPINQVRDGGDQARSTRREAGFCSCGMQLPLTGSCGSCD